MNNEYNIKFFGTLEEAFSYQNEQGGALYIKGEASATSYEYEIAEYLAEAEDEGQGRFVVVDNFIRSVIERECFKND